MKFERGKSARDPIYLRKPSNEYWMEGDIYENLCCCLTQIFGQRNFFIDSFTPIFSLEGDRMYKIAVTDRDGDTHGFIAKVVNAEEFDRTQRGGGFREEAKEVDAEDKRYSSEEEAVNAQDSHNMDSIYNTIENPEESLGIDADELNKIRDELKREKDIETLNFEMEREDLTEADSIDIGDLKTEDGQKEGDDIESEDKPKAKTRGRKKAGGRTKKRVDRV